MRLRKATAKVARDAAGWLLAAALVYSPWDLGGTDAAAIRNLNWILGAIFFLWLLSSMLRRGGTANRGYGRTRWTWLLWGCSGLLLVIGWGMALNAHSINDADYSIFLPLTSPLPWAPGSVDYTLSTAWMWRASLLLCAVGVTADLMRDERWLLKIWWSIGLTGGSIALLGLLQKATGAATIFWETPDEPATKSFFATYYYHGNAGAYLNLVLPLIVGLAYRYVTRPCNPVIRALWLTASVITIVAVFSDTSRMGQFVAILMVLALLAVSWNEMFRRARHVELRTTFIALVVLSIAIWAVTQASHLDQALDRWSEFRSSWAQDSRWFVDGVAIHALPQAGALGFGPGTFSVVFPYFLGEATERGQSTWLFLHNDYLQTLMEWGWVGGLLWAGVFFGGLVVAAQGLTSKGRSRDWFPRQRLFLSLVSIALGGVAIHALADFPLQISSIQLYAAIYVGICWGSERWDKKGRVKCKS